MWRSEEMKRAPEFGTSNEATYRVPLPLRDLTAGTYRLRVTATGKDATISRELDFRVVSQFLP